VYSSCKVKTTGSPQNSCSEEYSDMVEWGEEGGGGGVFSGWSGMGTEITNNLSVA